MSNISYVLRHDPVVIMVFGAYPGGSSSSVSRENMKSLLLSNQILIKSVAMVTRKNNRIKVYIYVYMGPTQMYNHIRFDISVSSVG